MDHLKSWHIWAEGHIATGTTGDAISLGTASGDSFKAACDSLAASNPSFACNYDPDRMTFWGCRLFDSENAARASFG